VQQCVQAGIRLRPAKSACILFPMVSLFPSSTKRTVVLSLAAATLLAAAGCNPHRYSSAELRKKTAFVFPSVYDTIITPLNCELVPIYKRMFFLKNDVDELKARLWDGGSNQRVMKIDNNIDLLKSEINALSVIRREILNTIYYIYPAYENPEVLPYRGKSKSYKKITRTVILVTAEDQREYLDAKSNEEKLSEEIEYKPLLAIALKKFDALPDSLRKPIEALGTPGPVPRIRPYTPPPLYRKE
jgi:hypothetical protein